MRRPGRMVSGLQRDSGIWVAGTSGQFMLAIRNDDDAQLATTDLAYSGISVDEYGRLKIGQLPVAIEGPGSPSVDSFASVAVDLAADTANQVLVAAPGGDKQIWVFGLSLLADTGAGTVTLQDEDDTALSGTMALSDEGGFVMPMSGNFAMPWIKVATNKALEADTVTCSADGVLTYAIVSV